MEWNSVEINVDRLKKSVLLVSNPKEKLKGTHVLKYIKWGEKQGFNERPTCASRDIWYDLDVRGVGNAFWTKIQRYRHLAPFNAERLIANCNLYEIVATKGINDEALCAMLNSTLIILFKHSFGRKMGGDPLLKTEVVDVKMMLVPEPRFASSSVRKRLVDAFSAMRQREALQVVDVDSTSTDWTGELALEDRQKLDDAVLELLGVSNKKERESLRAELYEEVTKLYRSIRVAEREMQRHRSANARTRHRAINRYRNLGQPRHAARLPHAARLHPAACAHRNIRPARRRAHPHHSGQYVSTRQRADR